MIFAHAADLGLKNLPFGGINPSTGLNRRLEDVKNNFRFSIDQAVAHGAKYYVIAGDINEERNPESLLIELFAAEITHGRKLGLIWIILGGNHDLDSALGTSSSIGYLKTLGIDGVHVVDKHTQTLEFDDVVFHCVPYFFPPQLGVETNDEVTKKINFHIRNIKSDQLSGKPNVLVSHYSTEDTFEGLNVDEPVIYIKPLNKFDYTALGHIHGYKMFETFNGGYSGSMFTKDFGELDQKRFNIVEIKAQGQTSIKAIDLPERKFHQLEFDVSDIDGNEAATRFIIDKIIRGLKDSIVKVKIKARRRFNPKLIYEHLRGLGVFHYAPIEWKIARVEVGKHVKVDGEQTDKAIVRSWIGTQIDSLEDNFKQRVVAYTDGLIDRWEREIGE